MTTRVIVMDQVDTSPSDLNFTNLDLPNESSCLFLWSNTNLFKLERFENKFNSWTIGDFIIKDGSLYCAVAFDPLYLMIPLLEKSSDRFCSVEDILYESDLSFLHPKLLNLYVICDSVTNPEEDSGMFRFSTQKTTDWLRKKVDRLVSKLEDIELTNYAKQCTLKDKQTLAIRLIGENLSQSWIDRLCQSYELKDLKGEEVQYYENPLKHKILTVDKKPAPKVKKAKSFGDTSRMKKVTDFFKKK